MTCGFTKKVKSLPFWSTTSSCHGIASPLSELDLSQKYRPQCNNDWSQPAAGVHQAEHQAVHVRGQAAQTKIRYASAKKKIKIRSYVLPTFAAAACPFLLNHVNINHKWIEQSLYSKKTKQKKIWWFSVVYQSANNNNVYNYYCWNLSILFCHDAKLLVHHIIANMQTKTFKTIFITNTSLFSNTR